MIPLLEVKDIKAKMNRVELTDEMLEMVQGGTSQETLAFIEVGRKGNLSPEEIKAAARYIIDGFDYGTVRMMFKGDDYETICKAVNEVFGIDAPSLPS